jgi:hypothetical protein
LFYADVVNRLEWDERTNKNAVFDYRDLIADEGRFAIRYAYRADFAPQDDGGMQDRHTAAAEERSTGDDVLLPSEGRDENWSPKRFRCLDLGGRPPRTGGRGLE